MMMKTILLMITLLMSTLWVEAMELKETNNATKITSSLEPEDRIKTLKRRISYVGITNLPHSNPNPNPSPNISNTRSRQCSINGLELTTYFPHYVYKDLGRKVRRIPQGNTNRVDYMLGDNFNIDKRFILVSIKFNKCTLRVPRAIGNSRYKLSNN